MKKEAYGPVIRLVSSGPGAGATTQKNLFLEQHGMKAISAGDLRRAIALDFSQHTKSWDNFYQTYSRLWALGGVEHILSYLTERQRFSQRVPNEILTAFNRFSATNVLSAQSPNALWDYITDAYALHQTRVLLSQGFGVVCEGDLAIANRFVDQLQDEAQKLKDEFRFLPHVAINFLLSVDPDTGALRVQQREGGSTDTNSIESRKAERTALVTADRIRYKNIYTVNGKQLHIVNYNKSNAIAVDTTIESADQIYSRLVSFAIAKFRSAPYSLLWLTRRAITMMTNGI